MTDRGENRNSRDNSPFPRTQVLSVFCFVKPLNSYPALGENQNSLFKEKERKQLEDKCKPGVLQNYRWIKISLSVEF